MSTAIVNRQMLSWARERSGFSLPEFARKFGISEDIIYEWEAGARPLTFKQAMKFAEKTHIPFGYLFLQNPPVETLPIPDLRTVDSAHVTRPSAELIDLLKIMLECQDWYRDYAQQQMLPPVEVVGSFSVAHGIDAVVNDMRRKLGVQPHPERGSWEDYYRDLVSRIEKIGILVMRQSYMGHHSRAFRVEEFRGLALSDRFAPIIFVNHSDTPGARLFTLIHELVHIWIGKTGISDGGVISHRMDEQFCNAVAAEFLVPSDEFCRLWHDGYEDWRQNLPMLETTFHVSKWTLARKALSLNYISGANYSAFIAEQKSAYDNRDSGDGGPSYYVTKKAQISQHFSKAVVSQALNGNLMLREAGLLLGMKPASVMKFAKELGF